MHSLLLITIRPDLEQSAGGAPQLPLPPPEGVLRQLFPGQEEKMKGEGRRQEKGRKEEGVETALLSSTHWSRTRIEMGARRRKAEKEEKKEPEESGERVVIFLYPTIDDKD